MDLKSWTSDQFTIIDDDGKQITIQANEEQKGLLEVIRHQHLSDEPDYNLHRIYHDFSRELAGEDNGYAFMQAAEKWAESHPEVIQTTCDDDHHCSSDIYLIPHYTQWKRMGVTLVYVPQCTGNAPERLFLYPGHLNGLISALEEMRDFLEQYPDVDTTSPAAKAAEVAKGRLLATVALGGTGNGNTS